MKRKRVTMQRPSSYNDDTGPFPGFGIVLGILVSLVVVGLIGYTTQPSPAVYSHRCRRYGMDTEEEEEDGVEEEYFEQPNNKNALSKRSQNLFKNVVAKRTERRAAKLPSAKPGAAKPPAAKPKPKPKPEAFQPEYGDPKKRKSGVNDVQALRIRAV